MVPVPKSKPAEPYSINQLEAPSQQNIKSWSVIQGRFDIYSWQRSLNFATQWFDINNDFFIKRGDPIFQISSPYSLYAAY